MPRAPGGNGNAHQALKTLIAEAGSLPIAQLRPVHVLRATANWNNLAPHTRWSYHHHLRLLLRRLEFSGAPVGISAHVPKVSKPAPRPVTATEAERTALLSHAAPPLRLMLLLCSDLALRAGTARRLAPCHYDREARSIATRTKNGRVVMLPTTDQVSALLDLCQQEGPSSRTPFIQLLGMRSASVTSLWNAFHKLKTDLGITRSLTFHDLRRTTAFRAYEITKDLRVVQALLGHQDLNTTLHYLDHRITPVPRELLQQVSAPRKDYDA